MWGRSNYEQCLPILTVKPIFLTARDQQKDLISTIFVSCEVSFAQPPQFDTVGIRHMCTVPLFLLQSSGHVVYNIVIYR